MGPDVVTQSSEKHTAPKASFPFPLPCCILSLFFFFFPLPLFLACTKVGQRNLNWFILFRLEGFAVLLQDKIIMNSWNWKYSLIGRKVFKSLPAMPGKARAGLFEYALWSLQLPEFIVIHSYSPRWLELLQALQTYYKHRWVAVIKLECPLKLQRRSLI